MEIEKLKEILRECQKFYLSRGPNGETILHIIRTIEPSYVKPKVFVDQITYPNEENVEKILTADEFKAKIFNPKKRGVFLIDVAGYSRFNTLGQAAILSFFAEAMKSASFGLNMFSRDDNVLQIIPTGDGCYVVFSESVNNRFFRMVFSAKANFYTLQKRILKGRQGANTDSEIGIRMACCLGEVDLFIDTAGRQNCYGIGLNEAQRILSCGQMEVERRNRGVLSALVKLLKKVTPNHLFDRFAKYLPLKPSLDKTLGTVFFSENVHNQAKMIQKHLKKIGQNTSIEELGLRKDKHGMARKVYWMTGLPNHAAFSMHSVSEQMNNNQMIFFRD